MSATLNDFASAMRESLQPHASRLLAEVRALQPKETGPLGASATAKMARVRRRTLRCRIGLHSWSLQREVWFDVIELGRTVRVCALCGKQARA
ncbi:hypothetical protein [uncultured Microbacterium sp.]|uniref:hypothetical protein n=1 Tax=uncultured Microbacterium sp. TaxID=191216 RepID=UPI0025CEC2F1|nr:hypothetical protein [uncultured Microbacterium sp.]